VHLLSVVDPFGRCLVFLKPSYPLLNKIRPTDSYGLRKKVAQVQSIVVKDLNFACTSKSTRTAYLYVVDKRVVGMLVAEIIHQAYLLSRNKYIGNISNNCSVNPILRQGFERTLDATKAMLGIHQLWVHCKFRQQGVASQLLTTARQKMVFGLIVPTNQTAFSSPTEAGIAFASL
jgi:hypothetical protein